MTLGKALCIFVQLSVCVGCGRSFSQHHWMYIRMAVCLVCCILFMHAVFLDDADYMLRQILFGTMESSRPVLTTSTGAPVADNQNSQTAGPYGPVVSFLCFKFGFHDPKRILFSRFVTINVASG